MDGARLSPHQAGVPFNQSLSDKADKLGISQTSLSRAMPVVWNSLNCIHQIPLNRG